MGLSGDDEREGEQATQPVGPPCHNIIYRDAHDRNRNHK